MKKRKEVMEYPDAPSGAIKLYNYKEPFMPFEETGIGFIGVLAHDAKRDVIQPLASSVSLPASLQA